MRIEVGVQLAIESMVQQPVADACFMYVAWLGVGDFEMMISAVHVCFSLQLLVQSKDMVHQICLKLLHVLFAALTPYKLLPRFKQIFDGNDIFIGMSENRFEATPPPRLLPVLEHIKQAYLLWHEYYSTLPKVHRYTVGARVDALFIEIIEAVSGAAFLPRNEKIPWVRLAIRKLDTLKVLLLILWETKSLRDKRYIALSVPLDEVGKMLGGWQGQLQKQNSPTKAGEK